ncbi:uncharacterized protein LOC134821979 [Bolinopsis microptera]|uniref:uncharacterized protein LOC134821979 n=1 Tax=Bolinopsis microptera TaxID=2820187 RepID=UPI0030793E51
MLPLLVVLILVASVHSDDAEGGYNALQFGTSSSDYVTFSFDMSPFRESLSICTWIKHLHTSPSRPTLFNYHSSSDNWEIIMMSNGQYTRVVGDDGLSSSTSGKFTTPTGKWFSFCLTWSLSSRTSKVYLDGELLGTAQTAAGRSLGMGGQLWFGRYYSTSSSYRFGGQLFQFNMFADVLSAADIKKIANGGLCFDLDELSETRVLRWEDIVMRSRSGSVSEVVGCPWKKKLSESQASLNETAVELKSVKKELERLTGQLNRTEDKLETETSRFNASQAELATIRSQLGAETSRFNASQAELATIRSQLGAETGRFNASQAELATVRSQLGAETGRFNASQVKLATIRSQLEAETTEHNRTLEELETCAANMTKIKSLLEGARKYEDITRWDVLFTAPYHNVVFSDDLYEQLTTSWGLLRKFVGTNITDGIISHFRHYHNEHECEVYKQLSWPTMLKQFVGVELTDGMIDHFRLSHEESPCENNTES